VIRIAIRTQLTRREGDDDAAPAPQHTRTETPYIGSAQSSDVAEPITAALWPTR
jgi:hypothetical protein